MTFLGRKYRATFQGEVTNALAPPSSRRGGQALDQAQRDQDVRQGRLVLRIETVINDPAGVFRASASTARTTGRTAVGWFTMNKGVANLYRYAEVSRGLTSVIWRRWRSLTTWASARGNWIEDARRSIIKGGTVAGCSPWRDDQALFAAALRGEHAIRGFRNRELALHLFGPRPADPAERRRQCGRVCRLIGLLALTA